MAVGTPKEQFKGEGTYCDERCDNKCILPGEGAKGGKPKFRCREDADCSLAGVCAPNGKCECDPWATGADCSYLRFKPVDRSRLGYLDEDHSWTGSAAA